MLIYGDLNKDDNTWTGVVGEVASDRADFGVAEFSMTNHRLDVVDFTLPLILSRNRIYFKKPDGTYIQWSAYFKVHFLNGYFILSLLACDYHTRIDASYRVLFLFFFLFFLIFIWHASIFTDRRHHDNEFLFSDIQSRRLVDDNIRDRDRSNLFDSHEDERSYRDENSGG